MEEKAELHKKFLAMGWGETQSHNNIFEFLYNAGTQVPNNATILDLGAGQCRYKIFFEHCNYIAVDFGIGDANWDFSKLDIVGDITKLDFIKDNSVDFCLNTVTLEHLNEPSDFLMHVQRILKPGGKLFLYAPFWAEEHQAPYDFFRFSSYGLKYLCEKNNLIPLSIEPDARPCFEMLYFLDKVIIGGIQIPRKPYIRRRLVKMGLWLSRLIMQRILMPFFAYIDLTFENKCIMPGLWCLTAAKSGELSITNEIKDKESIIKSIICCPKCQNNIIIEGNKANCANCNEQFAHKNGQVIFN